MQYIFFLIIGGFNCLLMFDIHKTKSYGLIAGYPEAGTKRRQEADKNIDIAGFARFMKNASFVYFPVMSAGIGVIYILGKSDNWLTVWFIITTLCFVISLFIVRGRYDYTKRGGVPEKLRTSDIKENPWFSRIITAVIVVGGLLPIGFTFVEPGISYYSSNFKINGFWGVTVPVADIADADTVLWKNMPSITLRTNGISLFGVNRGSFRTKDGENVRLSVKCSVSPVIRITDKDGKVYYINRKNPKETRDIFASLTGNLKK